MSIIDTQSILMRELIYRYNGIDPLWQFLSYRHDGQSSGITLLNLYRP